MNWPLASVSSVAVFFIFFVVFNSADASLNNGIGQTAKDIAEFWLHDEVVAQLSLHHQLSAASAAMADLQQSNYFCSSPLDRSSLLRTNATWLSEAMSADNTVFILFVRLDLVVTKTCGSEEPFFRIQRFTYQQMKLTLESHKPTVVFLGIERTAVVSVSEFSTLTPPAWFAVNVDLSQEELCHLAADAQLVSIHPRILKLARSEASVAGHARSILAWHDRYHYCPTCGAVTHAKDAGYKRICVQQECRSTSGASFSLLCCSLCYVKM